MTAPKGLLEAHKYTAQCGYGFILGDKTIGCAVCYLATSLRAALARAERAEGERDIYRQDGEAIRIAMMNVQADLEAATDVEGVLEPTRPTELAELRLRPSPNATNRVDGILNREGIATSGDR